MRQDEHLSALQPGARLHLYTIGAILGAGGFGITYKAREDITGREVAIKEFLPSAFAVRDRNGSTVRPLSEGAAKDFEWGLERFRQEAKLLIDLRHPNIVPVLAYFEANATGYLVMEFQEGSSLGQILRSKTLSESETLGIVVPLLDGVEDVHRHKFLHRDIKPENIFVRRDGTPVLLDFGAARQALGEHSKSFTTLLTEGYAPFEQYAGTGNQGPWSDIYALSSVMFRCLMGKPPAEAPRRAAAKLRGGPDPMAPEFAALRGRVSSDLAFAIEAGMRVVEHERPQTIAAFRELILAPASTSMRAIAAMSAPSPATGTTATATGTPATGTPWLTLIPDMAQLATALNPPSWSRPERKKPRRVARYAVIGVIAAAAAAGAAAYIGDQRSWLPEAFKRAGSDTVPAKPVGPATAEEPKRPPAEPPRPVDDAQRRAEEERKRAEDELKRAEEEHRDKAMGDHQRRQLEQTEGERRRYLDAQKSAEAERKRQEEQKAKTEAERKAAEERARADEERKRADDERKRAEEAARKRQEDENARGGAERTRRSEERKRAEDERRRADDERRRAEDAARKRRDEENARSGAERRAAEERARADDERKRAEDERKRAEDAARKRRDEENARDTRRDGYPPPPPAPPGDGPEFRRQPPDVPPARGRGPQEWQPPGAGDNQ